jgi:hypothetical protein
MSIRKGKINFELKYRATLSFPPPDLVAVCSQVCFGPPDRNSWRGLGRFSGRRAI